MRIGIIILLVCSFSAAQAAKRIAGNYSNPALGYDVAVPQGSSAQPEIKPALKRASPYPCPLEEL